jgi:transcriptional regulator with XRE-family HTH domain
MRISGAEMRELMKKAGIRQVDLATWTGLTARAIRRYEMGERPVPPPIAVILQLCIDHPETKDWLARQAKQRKPGAEIEDEGGDG